MIDRTAPFAQGTTWPGIYASLNRRADAWARIMARGPTSVLRADKASATVVQDDVIASNTMTRAGSALSAPSAQSLLGGNLCISFGGASRFVSPLAASAWNFTCDGTGLDSYHVCIPRNVSAIRASWSTQSTGINPEVGSSLWTFSSGHYGYTYGAAAVCDLSGGAISNGVGYVRRYRIASGVSPQASLFLNGSLVASAAFGAATATPPVGTLTLGATANGSAPAVEDWAATIFFNRALSTDEAAGMSTDLKTIFGVAG